MNIVIQLILLVSLSFPVLSEEISQFTSDGCSAFPDGTISENELWLSCCTAHDFAYWKGGTYDERLKADNDLQVCVSKLGEETISMIMLAGVRIGGTPFIPTSFRWGYGWQFPRGYGKLSSEEINKIQERLKK